MKDTVYPLVHRIKQRQTHPKGDKLSTAPNKLLLSTTQTNQDKAITPTSFTVSDDIIRYYSEVGLDYEPWSANYNMHFGYYRKGLNPFKREQLLKEMNAQVLRRLNIDENSMTQLLDMGCGVGATARYCALRYPLSYISCVTVVPWQIEKGSQFTQNAGLTRQVQFGLIDYRNTPFESNSFDGAYAIESSCYADGTNKESFIKEAFRVLKPGAKLVVTDGFRKKTQSSYLFEKAFSMVCKGWSVDSFANIQEFTQCLAQIGFNNIKIEEASWRVMPSVLHVPHVSIKYYLNKILFNKVSDKTQKQHFIAPLMGIVIGLHRADYGYYIISASKPK